ncbi:MAG: sulfatase [Elusimicrobia bacterium]|nr:sulfatase [Elusimicrobiota bacterium]
MTPGSFRRLRRAWVLTLALLAAARGPAPAAEAPLNVIVLDLCTTRADHFGSYGYQRDTTPHMDAFAKEGVLFENAMSMSGWCLPNYASLFTGHTPEVHGQYRSLPSRKLPSFETTLAEMLGRNGYATASFSGGVYFLKTWGMDQGFDTYVNFLSSGSTVPATFQESMPTALDWIETKKGGPFFLYVAVDDLHVPFQSEAPEHFEAGYDGIVHATDTRGVPFFRAYNRASRDELDPADPFAGRVREFSSDPRHLKHLVAHYDASLRTADERVGRFLDRLKKAGLWDKSLVIITADHGELLGEHGMLGHTESLYEPVVRVPLMVRHPRLKGLAGRRLRHLVERVDLMPTILDAAGIDGSGLELQGKSLLPVLREPRRPLREYAYASSKRNLPGLEDPAIDERVIRDRRWKLHWYSYKPRFELYDLAADPLEARDLAGSRPEEVGRLSFELMKRVEAIRPHAPGLPSGRPRPTELDEETRPEQKR